MRPDPRTAALPEVLELVGDQDHGGLAQLLPDTLLNISGLSFTGRIPDTPVPDIRVIFCTH